MRETDVAVDVSTTIVSEWECEVAMGKGPDERWVEWLTGATR